MDFQDFLALVPQIKDVTLPAEAAHLKLAPRERTAALENLDINQKNPRKAAVLMLLYPKNEQTHLVLILRNSYEGVRSAQIAFPGGKYESADLFFENTALRETHEEIGVLPAAVTILKPFTSVYIPPSNFVVYPFLGICEHAIAFTPDPVEVAGIIELPLTLLMSDRILQEVTLNTSYANTIQVPAFQIEQHVVWGATAMVLSELKEVLKGILG
ncbi:NUDIX hydrolase [Flavobacterium restrictum]|uniref:CoA pyrophosphatase n=1 Tax=Flavobacterium restrictum TaxID=2594428 RepID=A0A553E4D1_9FLAO|nr:CoA pyrophosphatase [Flavobacterium restrictum]TRX39782.1 CoA pyrophosphatase [Flavobacterium restrictum]